MKYKHGVLVTRAQPLTARHVECTGRMLEECDKVLIIIGSANKEGTLRNPFPIELRMKMVMDTVADEFFYAAGRVSVMPLNDLDFENSTDNPLWGDYLYDAIAQRIGAAEFTYYTGEVLEQSAHWFGERLNREVTPRLLQDIPRDVTATNIREALTHGNINFVVQHCPRCVRNKYYFELSRICQRVSINPKADTSTLRPRKTSSFVI